ncbi:uncharacterized protein N7500_000836 [Penicillium coprophilum]|uniref:uncharacterized protein n=1 Tax=Penicillium coprophilum TaxID=36646 RepID=UPI0023987EED|nr:uncharacterized protein N7500_000836 [Penicillium coprophilum]KAJ5178137.1 hypothetical protein N7500_000836 [Penicillium coprophilum]
MSRVYQSESVVSEEGAESFLAHLPSGTPVYRYNPQCAMTSLFPKYSVEDSFIVLKHFPPDILAVYEERLPGRCDYSPSLEILIITMPSQPHEEAASSFEMMLGTFAQKINVKRRIANCGATRVDTPERKKQADRSWKPALQGRKFPTLALEVGFSEATQKLEKDIAWWINGSKGEVTMGISIDIKRQSQSIEIKSWTPDFKTSTHDIYITARDCQVIDRHINNPPPPRMNQRILIKKGRDGASPTIEGGPLTVPFHNLLLDEPGEGEGDFVFTAEMLLHDLAEPVWNAIEDAEMIKAKERNTHRTA